MELTDLDSGRTRTVECDLVIFTADWIPDHELAVMAGCELDPGSLGPLVDQALGTTRRGVFAAGNLLHPAETADICALDGRHVAAPRSPPTCAARASGRHTVRLMAREPLAWVAPNLLLAAGRSPPRRPLPAPLPRDPAASRGSRSGRTGRELWRGRLRTARPGPLGPYPRRVDRAGRSTRAVR